VPVQGKLHTNAFAAARGYKTAMRPFAKLLCTLVPKQLPSVCQFSIFKKKLISTNTNDKEWRGRLHVRNGKGKNEGIVEGVKEKKTEN